MTYQTALQKIKQAKAVAENRENMSLGRDFDVSRLGLGDGNQETFKFHAFDVKLDRFLHIFYGFLDCTASRYTA